MDLNKALRELYEEKKRLDRAIARIESRLRAMTDPPKKSTRGRKSMGKEERKRVAARMTAYWNARRAKKQGEKAGDQPQEEGLPPPEDPDKTSNGVSA